MATKHIFATGGTYPLRKERSDPRGVTLDIIDDSGQDHDTMSGSVVVPQRVVLNGQSILMPEGTTITMQARDKDAAEVSITMMVRRLRIGHADELGADIPGGLETKDG